jgi:hypothetical protein
VEGAIEACLDCMAVYSGSLVYASRHRTWLVPRDHSSLYLLELGDVFLLAARIPVRMALQCKLSESLANFVLVRVGRDAQVCVVISSSIGLCHGEGEYATRVEEDGQSTEGGTLVLQRCRQTRPRLSHATQGIHCFDVVGRSGSDDGSPCACCIVGT